MMNRRTFLLFGLIAALIIFFSLTLTAQASPAPQVVQFATPTPGPDGRIIYIVQNGDNCIGISLKTGVPLDLIYSQNPFLGGDCANLRAGQELLLGIGGPAAFTPTPGPSPTPTLIPPTATPFTGTTEICVMLFDDINGDALREANEPGLANGEVSVTDVNGAYSKTQTTVNTIDPDTLEPVRACFSDVPEGTFNVSVAIPDGYNPTRDIAYRLDVKAGDRAFVDFGAQSRAEQAAVEQPAETGGTRIPWLGIVGGLLLFGGVGLGWYALRARRPSNRLGGQGPFGR